MRQFILLCFLIPLFLFSCKDDNPGTNNPTVETITTSLRGIVLDDNRTPVFGASVSMGGQMTTTDEQGFFRLENASVTTNRAFVTVEYSGYFQGSRSYTPTSNESFIRIQLNPKTAIGNVSSSTGGELIHSSGAKVDLPANGISTSSGSAYSGNVNVAAHFLDPTDPAIDEFMPGDLIGEDATGEEQGLTTFGMLAVELTDDSGNELNILAGNTATITIPVDASLISDAPSTIPLWSFDEVEGVWKEEGEATLIGNEYVGQVSHFSFWNCDAPFPIIKLSGQVVNADGSPVVGAVIKACATSAPTYQSCRLGYTDSEGFYCGKFPVGMTFDLLVMDGWQNCTSTSLSTGPFYQDGDVIPTITMSTQDVYTVSGSLVDCDGNAVTNGYIKIDKGNGIHQFIDVDGNGDFSASIIACNTTVIDLIGYDLDNLTSTEITTVDMATTSNLGALAACDDIEGHFMLFELDGESYLSNQFLNATYSDSLGHTTIWAESSAYCFLRFMGNTTGTFPLDAQYFSVGIPTGESYSTQDLMSFMGTVTITEYGNIGEDVEGTFSAEFEDSTMTSHMISGSFRVPR